MKDIIFKIHKLGPVENVKVKFASMVILTGESSLGKSYVNYLFYYFMSFFYSNKINDLITVPIDVAKGMQSFVIKKTILEDMLHEGVEGFMRNFLGDDGFTCDVDFSLPLPEVMNYSYSCKVNAPSDFQTAQKNNEFSFKFNNEIDKVFRLEAIDETFVIIGLVYCLAYSLFGKSLYAPVILPPGRGAFVG